MNKKVVRQNAVLVRFRSLLLLAGFLSLGYLTACSNVQHEVVANKQATAEARARTFTVTTTNADQSIWNMSYNR
ncbi:hypothetical protein BH10BDE1_BH10BDE1_09720 [soil metagenome]